MIRNLTPLALLLAAVSPTFAQQAKPTTPAEPTPYFSYGKPEDGGDMRCRIRTFRHPASGSTIVLAGTVHLADETFYERINDEIRRSDVALMEGVNGSPSIGVIPLAYQMSVSNRILTPTLLASQSDFLTETAPACENADVAFSEIAPGFGKTIGDFVLLPLQVIISESIIVAQSGARLVAQGTGNSGSFTAWSREYLTNQLTKAESMEELDNVRILDNRNRAVLTKLDAHLASGKAKRILIPWGAAHGIGLEKGLIERGCTPVSDEWVRTIPVASYEKSGYKTAGNHAAFHLPFLLSVRYSDRTLSHSGPLWIWDHTSAPTHSETSVGWLLLNSRSTGDGKESTALLAGLLHASETEKTGSRSLTLLGAIRSASEDKSTGTRETAHLLGFFGSETDRSHTHVRVGWLGLLLDRVDKTDGASSTSLLPRIFGRPLFYEYSTSPGTTDRHRFLLFFDIGGAKQTAPAESIAGPTPIAGK